MSYLRTLLVLALMGMASAANAQVSAIQAYCASQIPNNSQGLVTPASVRNCINYFSNNLGTVPYTGQVSTVYPLVAMGANISGTVSATYLKGDGSQITGISGTVTGNVSWSSIVGQPAGITNVSNSTGDVTATRFAGNISGTYGYFGRVSATTYYGNGSNLTGISAGSSNYNSLTNVPVVLQNISNSTGSVSVSTLNANTFTGGNFVGNGSGLTNVSATSVDYANVTNKPAGVVNVGLGTGSVTATTFNATTGTFTTMGIGSLTASGTVSAATLDAFFISGTQVAGVVGNFTGVNAGTLTASGLVSGALGYFGPVSITNMVASGSISATGSVSASTYYGDGSHLTGITGTASPSWYAVQSIPTVIQNISNSTGSVTVTTIQALTGTFANAIATSSFQTPSASIAALTVTGSVSSVLVSTTYDYSRYISTTQISSTGNISANKYFGDGSALSGIGAGSMTISATQSHPSTSIYVGFNSGGLIAGATGNATLGDGALASATTGSSNVAIGVRALASTTTAGADVAVGRQTLESDKTGGNNTAVGDRAASFLLNPTDIVAVGAGAGASGGNPFAPASGVQQSVFIGSASGASISGSTSNNVFVGYRAGVGVTTGSSNTYLGWNAGSNFSNAIGSNNIAIGSFALDVSESQSNQLNIGNSIYGRNMGQVTPFIGIGTQTPTVALEVNGTISGTALAGTLSTASQPNVNSMGGVTFSGTITPTLYGVDTSNTASSTEVLYVSGTRMDGAHGLGYFNVPNSVFIGTPTGVSIPTPSATLHVSGTFQLSGNAGMSGTTTVQNMTVLGTCTNCGTGGGGTSISTTTFTASTNNSGTTAIGFNAGVGTLTGQSNTLVGARAGRSITSGNNNAAFGSKALDALTTAIKNTAVGSGALQTNQTSDLNTGLGYFALNLATGTNNTAVGASADANLTTGTQNTSLGMGAGNATTGGNNTNLGFNTGNGASGASAQNTFVGSQAGWNNGVTGTVSNTTGIGFNALSNLGSGVINNTAVGAAAGQLMTTGNSNTLIGFNAGRIMTTGAGNTTLGSAAGSNLTTGGGNIIIGTLVNAISATVSSSLNIANAITGNIGSGTGNANLIGINVTSPTAALEVSGTVAFDNIAAAAGLDYMCYSSATGQVTYSLTTCTVSDIKFKTNVAPYNLSLDKVMAMQVREFDFKNSAYGKGKQVGLIAQEVQPIAPNLVSAGSNGDLSVDYAKLSVYAIGAIQELNEEVKELRAEIGLPPKHATMGERLKWLAGY